LTAAFRRLVSAEPRTQGQKGIGALWLETQPISDAQETTISQRRKVSNLWQLRAAFMLG